MICQDHGIANCEYCALDKTLQEIQNLLNRIVDLAAVATGMIEQMEPHVPHIIDRYEASLQLLQEVRFHASSHELFYDMYPDSEHR